MQKPMCSNLIKGTMIKNSVPKNIVHVMEHVSFQLYRTHPDGVIWKKTDN